MMEAEENVEPRWRARPVEGGAHADKLLFRTSHHADWISLTGSSRRIWELLEYPATRSQLISSLTAEYDANTETIAAAVDEALPLLTWHGLIEPAEGRFENTIRNLYLALLKRSVENLIYPELELAVKFLEEGAEGLAGLDLQRALRDIRTWRPAAYEALLAAKQHGWALRFAHTMIGLFRLHSLERCAERIFAD
jgi:hypothetical protein